jgi:hypothetical protein
MLSFEKCEDREAKRVMRNFGKPSTEYTDIAYDFIDSGIEVAKLTGFAETDAMKIYGSLVSLANSTLKEDGLKISKRGANIYLLNTKVNPVACAPEKR